jgi:IPT/TIG domain
MRRLSLSVYLSTLILFCITASSGQENQSTASPQQRRVPIVITVENHPSIPLREMPISQAERPRHIVPLYRRPLAPVPLQADPVLQTMELAAPLSLTAGGNFEGLGNNSIIVGSIPPDTEGSVSDTQYVQWINNSFAVFDKQTGNILAGPVDGNTLFSGTGGGLCETDNDGDPIVLWDKAAHRWLLTQFAVTGGPPFFECVAISTTSDATGTLNRYILQFNSFNDYPKIGVWPDAYYFSYNFFDASSHFTNAEVCALERSKVIAGAFAQFVCFSDPNDFTLLPSDLDGSTPPPAGSPNYFVDIVPNTSGPSTTLNLFKFHVDWVTPANSTFTGPTPISVAPYNLACGGSGADCIPQPDPTQVLESGGDRMMYRLAYRNFGTHESLVVNHSVDIGTGQTGIRWYELRNPGTTPTVFQQGTYAPGTNSRWMGSIAMDNSGDILLGYSLSSTTVHPSIFVAGRVPGDPLGTLESEVLAVAGGGSQVQAGNNVNRWGDYSTMSLDPVDDCTFWYTQEYLQFDGAFNWFTHISSFKFPTCGVVVAAPTVTSVSPIAGPTTGGNTVTINGTNFVSGASVKFGATASALVTFVSATQLKAVAPAHAAGTVDVTVTTAGGTSATVAGDRYTYDARPAVKNVSPNAGSTAGGNTVTINGTNFLLGTSVKFGATASSLVTFVSATQLKAVAPAHAAGTVDVTVTTPGGTSAIVAGDHYAYGPPTVSSFTPTSGITGSSVTINGTGFAPGAIVKFGLKASTVVTFVSGTQIKATVPNGAITGKISVTTAAGTGTSASNFTVTLSITGFSPTTGPAGTVVTITGIGFNSSSIVKFNGTAASSVIHVSSTQLKATVPSTATTGPITVTNTTAPTGTVRSGANYTKT